MTKSTKYQRPEEIIQFAQSAVKGNRIDDKTKKEFLEQANFKVIGKDGDNISHLANTLSGADPNVYHFLREVLEIKGIDLDRQNNKAGFNPAVQRRSLVPSSAEIIPDFKGFFKEFLSPSSSPENPDRVVPNKVR